MGGDLVVNILDKISKLAETEVNISAQILTSTRSTSRVLRKQIAVELRSQTELLREIKEVIKDSVNVSITKSKFVLFQDSGTESFSKQVQNAGIDNASLEMLAKNVDSITESVKAFVEEINKLDDKKLKSIRKGFVRIALVIYVLSKIVKHLISRTTTFFQNVTATLTTFAVVTTVLAPIIFFTTAIIIPMIFLWAAAFKRLAKNEKKINKGAKALMNIAAAVGLFTLALVASVAIAGGPAKFVVNSLLVGAAIYVFVRLFMFISKKGKVLRKASLVMGMMAISIALFSLAIHAFIQAGSGGDPMALLATSLALAFSVAVVGFAIYLLGKLKSDIMGGAIALTIASVGIYVIASAMQVWSKADVGFGDIMSLAGTLLVVGVTMAILGSPAVAPFVEAGAIVLLTVGLGLLSLAFAMKMWTEAAITEDDIMVLGSLFSELGTKVAMWGLMSPAIILGSAGLLTFSVALVTFSAGLMVYKKAGWTSTDSGDLVNSLEIILTGFVGVFKDMSFADITMALYGTALLGSLGMALSSFAEGMAAMAKLEVPTYEVKDGKLVLVSTKKLDPDFAQQVSDNITTMIEALVVPLAKFGEQSGMFTSGPVGAGIDLLGDLGNSLTNFAEGMAAMAQLQVPTYEVKDGKLVLVGTKQLDPGFAQQVAENITMMITELTAPLTTLGENAGMFTDGPLGAGISLLGDLGNSLANFAEGIAAMAQLQVPTYAVEDGKLVLKSTKQLDEGFAQQVGKNITMMVDELKAPLIALGESGSFFTDGPLKAGVETLGLLGNSLSNFAEGIASMAVLQIPQYEFDPETGELKMVGVKQLNDGFAKKVSKNIQTMIDALTDPLEDLGDKSGDFEDGVEMLGKLGKPIESLAKGMEIFGKLDSKSLAGTAPLISKSINNILRVFNNKTGYKPQQTRAFETFAKTFKLYAEANEEIEEPKGVADAIVEVKNAINTIDMRKMKELNKLFVNFRKLSESLKVSFDELSDVLDKLVNVVDDVNITGPTTTTNTQNRIGGIPREVTVDNLDEVVRAVDRLRAVMNGTIDVNVQNNLLN